MAGLWEGLCDRRKSTCSRLSFRELPFALGCVAPGAFYMRVAVGIYVISAIRVNNDMAASLHATDFLRSSTPEEIGPLVVLYGPQRSLKRSVLESITKSVLGADEDDDAGLTRYSGKEAELKTVLDSVSTISMWGDRRLVLVDDADEFVTKNRSGLENYVAKPARKSVLVLIVKSWPKNTRLAKAAAKAGLVVDCSDLKGGQLVRWLVDVSQAEFDKQLTRDGAGLMVELAGSDIGMLEQELSKLSAYVGSRPKIGVEDVRALVGGWKAETTWSMLNSLRDDDLPAALVYLDKLLVSGEAPQKILGGVTFVFRKFAEATENARDGMPLAAALKAAGVFPRDVDRAGRYLRRVGRPSAEKLYSRLLTADGNLKGNSRMPERVQLETLLVELSGNV